jgi:hypothetical protein
MSDLRDIATLCKEIGYLTAQVEILRKERDEARQRVCRMMSRNTKPYTIPEWFAEQENWDCYKEAK